MSVRKYPHVRDKSSHLNSQHFGEKFNTEQVNNYTNRIFFCGDAMILHVCTNKLPVSTPVDNLALIIN